MSKPRLYLAGPMTGIPDLNLPEFFRVGEILSQDWEVVNPATIGVNLWVEKGLIDRFDDWFFCSEIARQTIPLEEYLRRELPVVCSCEAIALLPGWKDSVGANKELIVARYCGLLVCDVVFDIGRNHAWAMPWATEYKK